MQTEAAGRFTARARAWIVQEGQGAVWVWAILLGLWLWLAIPLALGERTLVARDVFTTHLHLKWFGAQQLLEGRIPAFNPYWGLGQPFRGNPNALAFYPGNLLYLVLPFWSAFNLHYVLHWLLAFLGMRALARALGQSRAGALLAALTYAGCGYLLSAMTYYNILTVAAWWPLVLWGAARGTRRGALLGGLACGMALLGGEPFTAALGLAPLLLVAVEREGFFAGLRKTAAIGGLGLLVAMPQLVATWRILPFTYRYAHGLAGAGGQLSRLPVVRLLELLVPMPFGRPWEVGPAGFIATHWLPRVPYIQSLYFGVVALLLASLAAARFRKWTALAAGSLAAAWLMTQLPGSFEALTGGLGRYPEKLLIGYALATALLAGWGADRLLATPSATAAFRRLANSLALGCAASAILLLLGNRAVLSFVTAARPDLPPATAPVELGLWILTLAGTALLAWLAAWAARRESVAVLGVLQIVALLQLAVLVPTDRTAPYREPAPWVGLLPPGAAVFNGTFLTALADPKPPYRFRDSRVTGTRRASTLDLLPGPGVLHGLHYPLAPDFDGLDTLPLATLLESFPSLSWSDRLRWMRTLGVEGAVLVTPPDAPGLRALATDDREGVPTTLYAVESPSAPARALGGGTVRLVENRPDRIVLETDGEAGVAVVQRAYQPLLRAVIDDRPAPSQLLENVLLGIDVPSGPHRVVFEVSSWPEALAGAVALLSALLALGWAWKGAS